MTCMSKTLPVFGPVSSGKQHPSAKRRKPGIVVVKAPDGGFRWRTLDEEGRVLRHDFGTIHVVAGDTAEDAAAYERSRRAIQHFLSKIDHARKDRPEDGLSQRIIRQGKVGGAKKRPARSPKSHLRD